MRTLVFFLRCFFLFLVLGGTPSLAAQVQEKGSRPVRRGDLRLLWYNVENLFHPENDSLPGDDEFTPQGVRYWSYDRYRKKLTALARVIVAAGCWEPPELVGLGEVENARVLEDLVQHPVLAPYGYRFLHSDSPDHRGMDVACLYRKERIQVLDWAARNPGPPGLEQGTRDAIHLYCTWGQGDSLDLILVHLISKYGGAGATAQNRSRQTEWLARQVDSLNSCRSMSLKVLAGDFNEPWDGYSMEALREAKIGGEPLRVIACEGLGSYKYQGRWSQIDLILVHGRASNYHLQASILQLEPLIKTDEIFGGEKPARCYEGFRYAGGLSDHLPLILDISCPSSNYSER